jgi:hypothetical protein
MGPSISARTSRSHGDLEVGRDADEVAVEGGVMELAERQAVGNDRLAQGMAVGEDVGQPQPGFLVLISLVRRRDVEIDSRLGNQPILGHRCGLVRRSSTSRAGRARLGSRRYSASRSSARIRWDLGTGISPGFSEMLSHSACR